MLESLYQRMQETISDSGCKRLYQTADVRDSLSDSGKWLYIRQQIQESLYQTDAGDARESLYQTADACYITDSG